ncbi:MAG: hypothetical protein DCC67_15555 [Planctomycetota bacterium]|nr:MAG: hypothetical protein DCC67_15555 [Planctomycetota bacterium]
MSAHAATRIGPWRIEDITFQIPEIEGSPNIIHRGSLFRIGDPADVVPGGQSIRGLSVDDCYFTFEGHLSAGYLINPSEPASTDAGWYLNRPYGRNFAWQVTKGYDVALEDCSFRGWYVGGEFRHNDRFLARNWRGGANGRVIDVYAIPGAGAPVPAAIFGLWSEGHWAVGANLESCEVHGLNAESGYRGSYAPDVGEQDQAGDGVVPPGDADPYDDDPRRLVETVTWSMATGANKVKFPKNNIPPTVKLSDYFEPRTVVRFESSGQPPRYLYIEAIDDADPDSVHATLQFRNAATTSYIHAPMSGNGQQITRFFGTGVNLVGDKTAVFGHNVHVNYKLGNIDHDLGNNLDAPGDFPLGFVVPGAALTLVSGGVEGATDNIEDPSTFWKLVADDYGDIYRLAGGVRWIGPAAPNHPLVLMDGDQHLEYSHYVRPMEITRMTVPGDTSDANSTIDPGEYVARIRHRAFPGRGVANTSGSARLLRFRERDDTALGRLVPVHWLQDGPTQSYGGGARRTWMIPGLSRSGQPVDYVIRLFARSSNSADNDFVVYGGEGAVDSHDDLPFGWRTIRGHLDASQMLGKDVWLSGGPNSTANIDVAWTEFWQDEEN